jgi:hypothetical protein
MAPAPHHADAPHHTTAVRAAIEAMDGTLAMARALVEGGRRIDLAGLEREATSICAAVMALEAEQGRSLRPALESLLRQVDGLAARLALPD